MDVKELRIGNLIKDDECIIVVVEALSGDNALVNGYGENEVLFSKKGYPDVLFESEIHPIELTEELLFKCGFVAKSVHSNFVLGELELESCYRNIETNERSCFYFGGNIPDFMKIRIEYLHQLQNLIYALTGEELNVSEIV